MEPDHENTAWIAAELETSIRGTEKFDQFIVDNFDDLLARLDAKKDFLTDGFVFNAVDEIAGDLKIDVRFEQGETDFAEGLADVFLGDFAEPAQVLEGALKLCA